MKKIKFLFAAITLFTAVLCSALFCACNKKEETRGEIFTLQQAFDNGWITTGELQKIADLHNANSSLEISEIGEKTIDKIRLTAVNDDKKSEPNAKKEDYKILAYYGQYNGCYVIILNHPYAEAPAVIIDEWQTIGDVSFHYIDANKIKIWKNN